MKRFGGLLASVVHENICINLIGDIGAGKTTFTKGFATGLGIEETVQSPTFTISRVYDIADGRRLAHYDFYRLSEPGIMLEELHESIEAGSIVVIEWGDIVSDVIPHDSLTISFTAIDESTRLLKVSSNGQSSELILKELRNVTTS